MIQPQGEQCQRLVAQGLVLLALRRTECFHIRPSQRVVSVAGVDSVLGDPDALSSRSTVLLRQKPVVPKEEFDVAPQFGFVRKRPPAVQLERVRAVVVLEYQLDPMQIRGFPRIVVVALAFDAEYFDHDFLCVSTAGDSAYF